MLLLESGSELEKVVWLESDSIGLEGSIIIDATQTYGVRTVICSKNNV